MPGGSLYGKIRNWVGMEKLAYIIYDDAAWFEEMVETVADCIIGALTRILETGAQFEACGMWEDMAYNAGPLISPDTSSGISYPTTVELPISCTVTESTWFGSIVTETSICSCRNGWTPA